MNKLFFLPISFILILFACGNKSSEIKTIKADMITSSNLQSENETIILGGGCFWCIEAIIKDLKGVSKVVSGYSGGNVKNPSYRDVSAGLTGHAEVVKVTFDPKILKLEDLFEVFFTLHDPTTLNRQGADIGTQYRSVIFYTNDNQKQAADKFIKNEANKLWDDPIVTQVLPAKEFYPAEDYHQNYFDLNKSQPYCQVVINPKVKKLKEKFGSKLK